MASLTVNLYNSDIQSLDTAARERNTAVIVEQTAVKCNPAGRQSPCHHWPMNQRWRF